MAPRKTKRVKRSKSKRKRIGGDGEEYVWSSDKAKQNAMNRADSAWFTLGRINGETDEEYEIRRDRAYASRMRYEINEDKKPKTSIFSMFSRKTPVTPQPVPTQPVQPKKSILSIFSRNNPVPTQPVQSFATPVQQSAQPVP
jgi:hypothetical protein